MPLLAPLLEPVPGDVFQRTWNLLPCRLLLQYSTPNGIRSARAPDVLGLAEKKHPVPNGLRAGERDVRHCGTRHSKTFSAASGAAARRVHSSPDENREFFPKKSHPDGPRRPRLALESLAAAGELVAGSGTLAGDDIACPCHWPDTAARPATATISLPPCDTPGYSSAPKNEAGETIARTPSGDKFADGNRRGLAVPADGNHAE